VLAQFAGVPVYNGLTDEFHPTQILADLMTMREFTHKHLSDVVFCFVGDTGGNMGSSLMVGAALIGMDIRLCGPQSLWPDPALVDQCRKLAESHGRADHPDRKSGRGVGWLRFRLYRCLGVDGRTGGGLGRAHRASVALLRDAKGDEPDGQPACQVPALPACLPQPRHQDRREATSRPMASTAWR
jgi:hypothetical protein